MGTNNNVFPVAMVIVFGIILIISLIGCYWNEWQIVNVVFCFIMVLAAIKDLKNG